MASGYDVTIKLYQRIHRKSNAPAMNAIIVLDVFCICYTVISAVS